MSVETPIRVLEVVGDAIVGRMESWIERLVERLPRQRFVVTVLCPFESAFTARLRTLGIDVFIVAMPDDASWTAVQATLALVRSRGIELLHAHLPNAHLLAGLVARLAQVPVLTTVHGRLVGMLDLEVHHACGSHISVVCRQTELHALGVSVRASHLSFDANGVDTAVYRPRPRESGPACAVNWVLPAMRSCSDSWVACHLKRVPMSSRARRCCCAAWLRRCIA